MRTILIAVILAVSGAIFVSLAKHPTQHSDPVAISQCAHAVTTFTFEIAAPMKKVSPLFAPEAERSWAGDHWNPVFAYPQPGRDLEGAVFTVKHGPFNSVWVNTLFNVESGRMQYVAVFGEKFAMTVDVRVTAVNPEHTKVEVTYTRTALDPQANEEVQSMAARDKVSAPDWQHGIEKALGLSQTSHNP
jgi:hypothetical protein